MPGNPNSENPAQQKPYKKIKRDGQYQDAEGNKVLDRSAESHIPWNGK